MGDTQKYFISDVRYDLPTLQDQGAHMLSGWRKWVNRLLPVLMTFCVVVYAIWNPWALKWCCTAFLILAAIVKFREQDGGKGYQKFLKEAGGVPLRNLVYIWDAGIRCRNPELEKELQIAYGDITAITRTKTLFILTLANGQTILINHGNLTGGTADELERWLLERAQVTKIGRPIDNRLFRKATVWVAGVGLVLALVLDGGIFAPQPKSLTVSEAAQVLTELGIRVPEVDLEEELPSESMVLDLLYWAGMGEYNYETFEWTPTRSGVYAFDLEVFDVGNMYTNFLRGVEAVSGGELKFSDVVEDDSHVDPEEGTGWKEITFILDGQLRKLRAEMMYDWFDPAFANALADLTEDDQTGKRLRFLFDGYQVAYVFWCDEAWTREFAQVTGLRLTDSLG